MIDEAQRVIEQFRSLEEEMALPETTSDPKRLRALGQQHARLGRATELAREYLRLRDDIEEWSAAARGDDPDFAAEARRELLTLEARQEPLERELQLLLVPRDPADDGSCMVEVRAGTGGDEACLFAGELARMYQRYCENAGWRMTLMDATEGTVGGFREAVFQVEGTGAYGRLKFESGVHRVQRVPATEAQGRIHTSAASVVVLPEADEDVEITINPADLRIDTYRASGAGGQHINKTDSAVRMTHMPTGIVVSCQTERSQLQNRENCLKMLRAKLYDAKVQERVSQEEATRRSQVGSGDRSAKIRTFNYPQNRVTDHRINLTLYKLEAVLGGDLNELLDALQLADAMAKLGQV